MKKYIQYFCKKITFSITLHHEYTKFSPISAYQVFVPMCTTQDMQNQSNFNERKLVIETSIEEIQTIASREAEFSIKRNRTTRIFLGKID